MRIIIKATNIELIESINSYIHEKFQSLSRFLKKYEEKSELNLNIEIAKTTKHHYKGDVFYAEINLKLPHKLLRIEEYNSNLYTAIDLAKNRITEQLIKFKEINKKRK